MKKRVMLRPLPQAKPPYFSLASLKESLTMIFPSTIAAMVWEAVAVAAPKMGVDKTGNYIGANLLLGASGLISEFLVRVSKYVCVDKMTYKDATKKAMLEAVQAFPSYVMWQPLYDFVTGIQNFKGNELVDTFQNNKFNVQMVAPRWSVKPWLHLICYQGLALTSWALGASWRDTTCVGALSTGFQISTDHAVDDSNLLLTNAYGDPAGWSTVWNIGASGLYTAAAGFIWDMLIWKTGENLYDLYQARKAYYAALKETAAPIDITIHRNSEPAANPLPGAKSSAESTSSDEKSASPTPPATAPESPNPTSPLRAAGMHKPAPAKPADAPDAPLLAGKTKSAWAVLRMCGY